jgi:hypothetical protein
MVRSLPPFRAIGLSWVKAGVDHIKNRKIKNKINGSGQECPLHTGFLAENRELRAEGCIIHPP